jgi:DNA-binding response OmpR family regulator
VRALIADDDRSTTLMLSRTLERWGVDTIVAHDGAEAWDMAQSLRPSLGIFDWMMPSLDGIELCTRIRADETLLSGMYILLLTSRDARADVVAGRDAGADDYLVKPFDPDELRARVHVGIRVIKLQDRLAERVVELQEALARVKQLHGLLPICSYCKRIRSDENYWQQLESYVSQHSDAQFSHSICPVCFEQVMAQFKTG